MTGDRAAIAARALALLDLTDLNDNSSAEAVEALAARGKTRHGPVAALCIWPRFVGVARAAVGDSGIRIATVVNFPHGGTDIAATIAETGQAIATGADEIDLVLPYRAFLEGDVETASEMIDAVKATCAAAARLKVILETGMLAAPEAIDHAARLAIAHGADFIKTSTGKVAVNATPEAADIMLGVIADTDRMVGFKPAGGIRTVGDAALYLDLAGKHLGADWADPDHFRFGASGLLDDILAVLDGKDDGKDGAATGSAY